MHVIAFDVDETLQGFRGPVTFQSIDELRAAGHIVGVCGNWIALVRSLPEWHRLFSFIGPIGQVTPETKATFLRHLSTWIPADGFVMVGNDPQDRRAAELANWQFIVEADFARGVR